MPSRIVELARIISAGADHVDQHLTQAGLAQPSFDENAPKNMVLSDKDAEKQRIAAISAAAELQDLLLGPHAALTPIVGKLGSALASMSDW